MTSVEAAATLTEQEKHQIRAHRPTGYIRVSDNARVCCCGPVGGYEDHLFAAVESILAARLAGLAVNETAVTDEAVEAAANVIWPRASKYLMENGLRDESRLRIARAALTAAAPHMGNGQADAWDEGHLDVCVGCVCPPHRNPYRLSPTGDE